MICGNIFWDQAPRTLGYPTGGEEEGAEGGCGWWRRDGLGWHEEPAQRDTGVYAHDSLPLSRAAENPPLPVWPSPPCCEADVRVGEGAAEN